MPSEMYEKNRLKISSVIVISFVDYYQHKDAMWRVASVVFWKAMIIIEHRGCEIR
jgi:hypothetical protein